MKRINKSDYQNDGVYIDLDISYIPYEKLIYDPDKYLSKSNHYYFHCKNGVKSKEVVMSLDAQGYNVTQVI